MPRVPFHKYLGPGNTLDEGEPVSNVDYIAREHDTLYEDASSKEAVFNSDNAAIQEFLTEAVSSYDPSVVVPALIGAVGLKIKNVFETFHNDAVYPDYR